MEENTQCEGRPTLVGIIVYAAQTTVVAIAAFSAIQVLFRLERRVPWSFLNGGSVAHPALWSSTLVLAQWSCWVGFFIVSLIIAFSLHAEPRWWTRMTSGCRGSNRPASPRIN